ncbi:MAG: transcriptional repressor [Clostridiales bacterium]|nr:transcriptional repressor [Clostridiales bacterium]
MGRSENGTQENGVYYRATEQKQYIIAKLKERGFRITNQRKLIIDCILANEFSCCKEIYCQVCKIDPSIGIATVYRMVNTLEDIGAINRKNMYHVCFEEEPAKVHSCMVQFDDHTRVKLSPEEWKRIVKAGLKTCGYLDNRNVELIEMRECNHMDAAGVAAVV